MVFMSFRSNVPQKRCSLCGSRKNITFRYICAIADPFVFRHQGELHTLFHMTSHKIAPAQDYRYMLNVGHLPLRLSH